MEAKNVLLLLLGLILSGCQNESYWEKTLDGPFQGIEYSETISQEPEPQLQLNENHFLEVYEGLHDSAPVLALRRMNDGRSLVVWAKAMVPIKSKGSKPQFKVNQIKLENIKSSKGGFKVRVSCDWTGGGIEDGLIYLSNDFKFKHFALGW